MPSRGFFGFVTGSVEKISYVHDGSYPSIFGTDVLRWLRRQHSHDATALRRQVAALRVQREPGPPPDDFALTPWANLTVSSDTDGDWYRELRETQGDPAAMLAAGVIEARDVFPADGVWAKWGYVVNLDTDRFEVYLGCPSAPRSRFPADGVWVKWGYVVDLDTDQFEVYQGSQSAPHSLGRFVSPAYGDWHPRVLVYSWPLAQLPSAAVFTTALNPFTSMDT